jgi:hypothetical protein
MDWPIPLVYISAVCTIYFQGFRIFLSLNISSQNSETSEFFKAKEHYINSMEKQIQVFRILQVR